MLGPRSSFASISLAFALTATLSAQPEPTLHERAPAWPSSMEWFNLPEGKERLTLDGDLRGKVVVIYCFQSWCPGCRSHGFPTLKKLVDHYDTDADDVAFVAIQTVFEGFAANTLVKARAVAEKFDLDIPFAHDAKSRKSGRGSQLMRDYRTHGTPYTIVIGKDRRVHEAGFHVDAKPAIALIDRLREQEVEEPLVGEDVGRSLAKLKSIENRRRGDPAPLTLYRWWTDGCKACESSLPDLAKLNEAHGEDLHVVAVHHHKGSGRAPGQRAIVEAAQEMGFADGEIAMDRKLKVLKDLLERGGLDQATSISILVDAEGRVVWSHPGPVLHYYQGDDLDLLAVNADMVELDEFVAHYLAHRDESADEDGNDGERR